MTYEFEYLMHLFSCGSRGTIPKPPCQPVDFDRLIQLAQEHSVLPLVGMALSNTPDTGFPIEKVKALVARTRSLALTNYVKKSLILKLLKDFEEAGIQAVLLKGFAVADLYAEPNCRISTDTDIYIDMKDEKQACKLLGEHGCKVNPRSPTSHHTVCEHPQMGHIELHILLYDEIVEDIWFGKMNDRQFILEAFEKHATEEGSYHTLGKTDNLIFLTLHMIKHFILSGISLRQMMDIALYFQHYQTQIDIKRFWKVLESLKYRKLMNTILSAMVMYCSFFAKDFPGFEKTDEFAISALMTDLETGGWLGSNNAKERKGAWYKYNQIRFTEKKTTFSYLCYMMLRSATIYLPGIFPPRSILQRKYPYIKKMIWLTPVAWVQHLLTGFAKLLCGKLDTGIAVHKDQIPADEKDRIRLFKMMEMM